MPTEKSDSDAVGIAYMLENCNCGLIVECKDKLEGKNAYMITFENDFSGKSSRCGSYMGSKWAGCIYRI